MIDPAATDYSGKLAIDANSLNSLKLAAKNNSPESVKQVATQFESMFVNMMLKSMRDASPQDGPFDSEQSRTFTTMLDQQLSQSIAARGIGLADMLVKQLSKNGEDAIPAVTPAVNAPITNNKSSSINDEPAANIPVSVSDKITAFQDKMAGPAEEASASTGIPANFMIGHAALESGWGKHEIKDASGQTSYNLFGIKATANWTGKVVSATTTEYVHGVKQLKVEKFRAYDSYADAFKDFGNLMRNNPRYSNVMNSLQNATSYAKAVQTAGYATDPAYATKLSQVIQKVSAG